jgi:hypothetical protein
MYNERRDNDWVNPPEPKEDIEPDVDAINDDAMLRRKQQEEEERQQKIIESCCQLGDIK